MGLEQIVIVLLGALAGGFVNGLTGFGTALTAMGIWLYAIPPTVASSLVIACSVISHIQMFPLLRKVFDWRLVAPFVVPGLIGVPIGTWLLPMIDPRLFKIVVGFVVAAYATYALLKKPGAGTPFGGRITDGAIGFSGGVLGGLAGLSGALLVVWCDVRAWGKEHRRTVLQTFNFAILAFALASHAVSGLLTRDVGIALLAALPGTLVGAWFGARLYLRLGDRNYQQVIMVLLLVSGVMLLWTNW